MDAIPQKLDYVDALQGIAILGVILVHSGNLAPGASSSIIRIGALGVQLFFVLSAFTLLRSMALRRTMENAPIRNFFIRRVFRIAPLFYIAIVVSLALDGLAPRYYAPNGLHLLDILTTVLFVNGWQAHTINSIVPGGWCIPVEMTFYAFLPVLWHYIRSFEQSVLAWGLAVVVACATSPLSALIAGPHCPSYLAGAFDYMWLPGQLPVFLSGFILFFAIRDRIGPLHFVLSQGTCMVLLAIAFLASRHCVLSLHRHTISTIAGIAFSGLAYFLSHVRIPALVNSVTRYIGVVSYSAYISHFWVIRLPGIARLTSLVPRSIRLPFAFLLVAALTVLLSTFLHKIVEVPFQNIGRSLIERWEDKSVHAAPTA